ncbi:hypothetical protein METSCH_A03440 [Metschnikowia aff. pulcherrima]|uniref:Uncharacterized protein n=1 Tax=Metschnikowia aff. pulcherrima TaxID=2163413 RepID=A0A4P6XGD9_9ASCO|nr:hypothetical protein METSCH_A03440 [Metschnikowia aff. pulcherrima]
MALSDTLAKVTSMCLRSLCKTPLGPVTLMDLASMLTVTPSGMSKIWSVWMYFIAADDEKKYWVEEGEKSGLYVNCELRIFFCRLHSIRLLNVLRAPGHVSAWRKHERNIVTAFSFSVLRPGAAAGCN